MQTSDGMYTVASHVTLWLDVGGSIHIKTREPHGDPVEMNEEEALELASILTTLADSLRS